MSACRFNQHIKDNPNSPVFKQVNAGKTQLNGLQGGHSFSGTKVTVAAVKVLGRASDIEALEKGERSSGMRDLGRGVTEMAGVGARRIAAMTVERRESGAILRLRVPSKSS